MREYKEVIGPVIQKTCCLQTYLPSNLSYRVRLKIGYTYIEKEGNDLIDEQIVNHPSYQYALSVVNEDVISGRYIKKECSKFLDELDNEESKYFFDVEMLETLDNLTKLINMADGMKEGVSAYEALGGFQWYFLANVLCWKYKENPERRKYEKSILLIGRKNGKYLPR